MRNKRVSLFFIVAVILPLVSACGGLSSQQQTSANDALKALKKVQAATQVGVNYPQYNQLVIEAQAAVNDASVKLPDGDLKKELQATIEAYADAGEGWSKCKLSDETEIGRLKLLSLKNAAGDDTGQRLRRKYHIKTYMEDLFNKSMPDSGNGPLVIDSLEQHMMLTAIWAEAEKHLNRAASLLHQ
jgi:hypothetical protein